MLCVSNYDIVYTFSVKVQGGSPQFYNTFKFFEKMGYKSTEVGMQISFGKGGEKFWTNVFPSELVAKHASNIKKFGRVLKIIKMLEPLFAVMSVQAMLKLFRFPQDFGDRLIYPLIALFMVCNSCLILSRSQFNRYTTFREREIRLHTSRQLYLKDFS